MCLLFQEDLVANEESQSRSKESKKLGVVTDISWFALGSFKLIMNYQTCTQAILLCTLQTTEMRDERVALPSFAVSG